jgi:la-related protein 1
MLMFSSPGAKSKKGKAKSKWVAIPPAELQAAADAAAAAARKASTGGHTHAQGVRKGNKGSTSNSTNANTTNGTNTSAHNTPRSHSGRTSAVQSRVHSAQNSPRTQRGRRLPAEEGVAGMCRRGCEVGVS